MSTAAQLRIAARIHFHLKHLLNEGIDVAAMLSDTRQAQEVLWVCHASGDQELQLLAREYESATERAAQLAKPPALSPQLAHPASAPSTASQDTPWANNTTGFGQTGFDSTGFGVSSIMPSTEDSAGTPPRHTSSKRWLAAMARLARRNLPDTH